MRSAVHEPLCQGKHVWHKLWGLQWSVLVLAVILLFLCVDLVTLYAAQMGRRTLRSQGRAVCENTAFPLQHQLDLSLT